MEQDLASLRDFSEAMQQSHEQTGVPLSESAAPPGRDWRPRARATARDRGCPSRLRALAATWRARQPLAQYRSKTSARICALQGTRSAGWARACWKLTGRSKTLRSGSTRPKSCSTRFEARWSCPGCRREQRDTFEEVHAILEFAARAEPLAESQSARRADQGPRRQGVSTAWPHELAETTRALLRGTGKGFGLARSAFTG